ncbi:uncharacterized protein Tco025E_06227 [Trypanosoma conorhini]|uniref:Uncharacterized protein n=1 Tax=Trypanosoma conorhini TaxID=83891 RepID=A0A3R7MDJ6_9TRYP|nr:uncharacterized protein Tco025E_06227 [Trypanosoma conorhini]RNF13298.1 hypothetical protein Tco025E_06227 [Trypanosoma conorhini]
MSVDVLTPEPAAPVTCQRGGDADSSPGTADATESCGGSSSRDDSSGPSQLCRRCAHPLFPAAGQEEGELSPTTYLSIVRRLQAKVHALQEALLASSQCASLLDSLRRPGELSTTEVPLQQPRNSGEGNVTRRMRSEWLQAVEANNAITSLQHVSSQIGPENFNAWMSGTSLNSWKHRGVAPAARVHLSAWEDAGGEEAASRALDPKEGRVCGATKAPAIPCVAVDPVILVDITAVMHKNESRSPAAACEEDVSRVKLNADAEHLTAENVRLREEAAEARRALEGREEEVRRQQVELAALSQTVKQLQECNSKLQEACDAMQRRCDDATETARASESRLKKLTATIDSLEAESKKRGAECAAARRETEDAWQEVRRLESALRAWEVKERELQRLRLLMRFSELKKDSDRLTVIAGEMESAENERDRLREENKRCRELLSEYRRRLEVAVANAVRPAPATAAPQCPSMRDCEVPPVPETLQATVTRPRSAAGVRGPRRPSVASDTAGRKRKKSVPHLRHRRPPSERHSLGFASLFPGSRRGQYFFGDGDDGASYPHALRK